MTLEHLKQTTLRPFTDGPFLGRATVHGGRVVMLTVKGRLLLSDLPGRMRFTDLSSHARILVAKSLHRLGQLSAEDLVQLSAEIVRERAEDRRRESRATLRRHAVELGMDINAIEALMNLAAGK